MTSHIRWIVIRSNRMHIVSGIAAMNKEFMAPAVRTMYNHVLEQYQQEEWRKG